MKTSSQLPCILFLYILPLVGGCGQGGAQERNFKFKIAIVGDGVPHNTNRVPPPTRIRPLNTNQGKAMYDGALAAFESSEIQRILRDSKIGIEIESCDDGGDPDSALRFAAKARQDPRILAIIGHGNSSTTRVAAPLYAECGIPLLMPIATGPTVAQSPGAHSGTFSHLPNCFRLPSSDSVQARALSRVATSDLKATRCFLIRDVYKDAAVYSSFLNAQLEELLKTLVKGHQIFDPPSHNAATLASTIRSKNPDLIIFCGYADTLNELLPQLRSAYQIAPGGPRPLPRLLVSDGCNNAKDLQSEGFEIYLTFPCRNIKQFTIDTPDFHALSHTIEQAQQQGQSESYQAHGYDAMLLIADAIGKRESKAVSRGLLSQHLNTITLKNRFQGAYLQYAFSEGENVLAEYCLYQFDASQHQFLFARALQNGELKD